jgi:cleavage and polyadenylation specificity factor subunit 1
MLRASRLPNDYYYGQTGWPTYKVRLGEEVTRVTFFESKGLYAVSTTQKAAFKLPEDPNHPAWEKEDTSFPPMANQGYLKLLHPVNWEVLHILKFDEYEICLSLTSTILESSEITRTKKPFICAGTVAILGEDQQSRGKIYAIAVSDVVPVPGKPETGHAFRIFAKEDVKGAVTAVAGIGPSGALLVAQGQKVHVRGLVEADKIVPMAFMDTQIYVTVVKVLKNTGMILLGDIAKGLWFAGFTVSRPQ